MTYLRLSLYLFICTFFIPSVVAVTQTSQGFVSIAQYSIGCAGFEENFGKTFENYVCSFNYSRISRDELQKGCFLVVRDETKGTGYKQPFLNKSFSELFSKTEFLEAGIEGFYEYSANENFSLKFEEDGRHVVSFYFDNCEYEPFNSIIEKKAYDIISTENYFLFQELREDLKKSDNKNTRLTWLSLILGATSLILALKTQKAKVVEIKEDVIDKITAAFKNKK